MGLNVSFVKFNKTDYDAFPKNNKNRVVFWLSNRVSRSLCYWQNAYRVWGMLQSLCDGYEPMEYYPFTRELLEAALSKLPTLAYESEREKDLARTAFVDLTKIVVDTNFDTEVVCFEWNS